MKKVVLVFALLLSFALTGCHTQSPIRCNGDSCPIEQQGNEETSIDKCDNLYGGPILRFLKRQQQKNQQRRQNRQK